MINSDSEPYDTEEILRRQNQSLNMPDDNLKIVDQQPTRIYAASISFAALIGLIAIGYTLLVTYAFSTMVNPDLPTNEQTKEIARKFLYADQFTASGLYHFAFVALLICLEVSCIASFLIHGLYAICKWPLRCLGSNWSLAIGFMVGSLIIGSIIVIAY